jgi:hypothetical protein
VTPDTGVLPQLNAFVRQRYTTVTHNRSNKMGKDVFVDKTVTCRAGTDLAVLSSS